MSRLGTDDSIRRDILDKLRRDVSVREAHIGVLVHDAVVILSGNVESFAIKATAQAIAHRVTGVLDVVNDLEVCIDCVGVEETAIAHAVRAALEAEPSLPHRRIHTTISHGTVTLEGVVSTLVQRDAAAKIVRRIPGVVGVMNWLDVSGLELTSDDIREALRHASLAVERLDIEIHHDGRVTIRGPVRSWAERSAIADTIRRLLGVGEVTDETVVDEQPAPSRVAAS